MKPHLLVIILFQVIMLKVQPAHAQITQKELNDLVYETRQKYNLPALTVILMNSNDIFLKEIQGVCCKDSTTRVTFENYFHIGSCSKSVLAILAGKMVEEQKLKWRTSFFEVFPELKSNAKSDYQEITLEDLLLCQAGIKAYTSGDETFPQIDSASTTPRYKFAKYLLSLPPANKKKSDTFEFHYSNASYALAALMLERVSNMSYEEMIKHYLSRQLGIKNYIGFPNQLHENEPWGHLIQGDSIQVFTPTNDYKIPTLLLPAGDLSMPPLDFAKYIQMNLKGLKGNNTFLKRKTYTHIHFGYETFSLGVANGKISGMTFSGMDGSAGTFFCRALILPKHDLAFVIMTNAGNGTGEIPAINWLTQKLLKYQFNWWWKFWM